MLLKIPAPITAAIPSAVRSLTPNTLLSTVLCPSLSLSPSSASFKIAGIDFLRNTWYAMGSILKVKVEKTLAAPPEEENFLRLVRSPVDKDQYKTRLSSIVTG